MLAKRGGTAGKSDLGQATERQHASDLGEALGLGRHCPRAAAAGALLFAVHPVHVEAIAWVTGRSEILAALFACLAFALALDAARGGGAPRLVAAAADSKL